MTVQTCSTTFVTENVADARRFYGEHFGARATFDCGWYVVLRLGDTAGSPEVCFMEAREGSPPFAAGATLNLRVDDVDGLHGRVVAAGLQPTTPLGDHPWGDRGFGVADPCGVIVYCYEDIEPAPEFRQYFLEV